MLKPAYDWKRFWCPRGASIRLTDNGYLFDPDILYGSAWNPHVIPFDKIATTPCLALLAEPGMGKTQTMHQERAAIEQAISEQGDRAIWLDLRSYGSEDRLVRDLFDSVAFRAWAESSYRLNIFLDSLDEALLRIDTLSALLIDELSKYPVGRLSLRIACRTAEWPVLLEQGLRQLWGEHAVGIYELTPLRRIDVIQAAQANQVDPESFLREVDRMSAGPLASKPVTLNMLLSAYRDKGSLPPTQAELYYAGCRLLCEETSNNRRSARLTGKLSGEERLLVAGRIAAATIFGNRFAVWMDIDRGTIPAEDVSLAELTTEDDEALYDEEALRETLSTGLFSSRGLHRMGWAHQTYAEFLSAWYLRRQKMTVSQIMSILAHPGDPEHKLAPQLHEPAAWIASLVPGVFQEIMRTDPEVLLRSNAATADEADRKALVTSLLRLYEEEKLYARFNHPYHKLAHRELASQLRPYLVEKSRGIRVRQVAIDMAEACDVRSLQGELVSICLDITEPIELRVNAAHAVVHIGDVATKIKLKPLALEQVGDDPQLDLKGYGLKAVWPSDMTARELFATLSPPKRSYYSGSYESFLAEDIIRHLQPVDLPIALEWITTLPSRHQLGHVLGNTINAFFLHAWHNLDIPGVVDAFAKAALSRLQADEDIVEQENRDDKDAERFRKQLREDNEKRRRVAAATLRLISATQQQSLSLIFSDTPLFTREDIPWLVARLMTSSTEDEQTILVELIERMFYARNAQYFELVYDACQKNKLLAEKFSWLLNPIRLDSPEAQAQKEAHYKQVARQERRAKPQLIDPPPDERVARALNRFETGDIQAWWQLTMELSLEPDSTYYANDFEVEITTFPGWIKADTSTRLRIIGAAKRYVMEGDPQTDKWIGTRSYYYSALAGYRALHFLLQVAPAFITDLPAALWQTWAPIVYAHPRDDDGEQGPHRRLIQFAYTHASEEVIKGVLADLKGMKKEGSIISIPSKLRGCWDDRLAGVFLSEAKDRKLNPGAMSVILEDLLYQKYPPAIAFVRSRISTAHLKKKDGRARAVAAARLLITYTDDIGWSTVWPAMQQDRLFGREVIETIAQSSDRLAQSAGGLTEAQLADLYIWLEHEYPHAEDPQHEGEITYSIGPREKVAMWRDSVLRQLQQRGTPRACEEIRRIAAEFPNLNWLKWTLLEAQNITRRMTWIAPSPRDIILLTRDQRGRLIQSGEQLLTVVLDSLRRLEAKLQGEVPAVIDLWNEADTYTPKDENRLSDYIKRHLDQDLNQRGVVINREVVIRRGTGDNDGERTDLHVNAVIRDQAKRELDVITVIIETKGCWHNDVLTAMETQLVQRYLKDNRCQHGIYLIGWFYCKQWKQPPKKYSSKEALQKLLAAQADDMSRYGVQIEAFVLDTRLR